MKNFLMICYVCARFISPDGDIFEIRPAQIGVFVEAPEWVKKTLLFRGLVNDGSIKVAEEQISKRQGENDPMDGIAADGKVAEKPEEEKVIKTRKKAAKKEDPEQ